MKARQRLLAWLNNLLVPAEEKYVQPKRERPLVEFTFLLVGLDRVRTVIATNEDDARRKVYTLLTPTDIERLEWADLILTRLHRKEKP